MKVLSLTPYLWHSYWRTAREGGFWKNANMMSMTGFSLFGNFPIRMFGRI